ncbi:hypothetical protein AGLY_003833 [Aphis glycines]|uniref:Uncharacterized protein n=1 Tax=Aphis glycines TaxID=307491 RepID=A0A6G0TZG6_APHGL|nr:hypothetical protein AGLY_003833 [Aphis glycines]
MWKGVLVSINLFYVQISGCLYLKIIETTHYSSMYLYTIPYMSTTFEVPYILFSRDLYSVYCRVLEASFLKKIAIQYILVINITFKGIIIKIGRNLYFSNIGSDKHYHIYHSHRHLHRMEILLCHLLSVNLLKKVLNVFQPYLSYYTEHYHIAIHDILKIHFLIVHSKLCIKPIVEKMPGLHIFSQIANCIEHVLVLKQYYSNDMTVWCYEYEYMIGIQHICNLEITIHWME